MDKQHNPPEQKINVNKPSDDIAKQRVKYVLRNLWSLLVTVAPVVTVAALGLAVYQSYQAIKSEQKIEAIAGSVSTQYVNVFPDNMPKINELLEKTQKSLVIVSDIGAYGHFSSPHNSNSYVGELDRLSDPAKKIDLEFICYSRAAADEHLQDQFGLNTLLASFNGDQGKAWQKFHDDHKDAFAAYRPWHYNKEPIDMDDLKKQINDATDGLLTMLRSRKGQESIYLASKTELPIFMWIIDDKEAIFSFHTYGQNAREDSFRTTDPRFIARLKEIKDEAKRRIRDESKSISNPTQNAP
jgi:hypothetical protein